MNFLLEELDQALLDQVDQQIRVELRIALNLLEDLVLSLGENLHHGSRRLQGVV